MSRTMTLIGAVVLTALAVMMSSVPGSAGDRVTTRPVESAYRDPVGDGERGHGDITGVWISDSRGIVTFSIDLKTMHDTLVIDFDTDFDGNDNYTMMVGASGGAELDRLNKADIMFKMRAPTIVRTPSRHLADATTYTFRFKSSYFGGTRGFSFEAHVDTPRFADVSDWAPNGADDGARWDYELVSR